MISVEEAKQLLAQYSPAPLAGSLPLQQCLGMVLAQDVFSPIDMPSFEQSAMDGYALAYSSFRPGQVLPVHHTIQAGATELPLLPPGEAARIFTGAPLPRGADTVVMQEKVERSGNNILILDEALKPGSNVRPRASQTEKGALAACKGTRLSPGGIGLLASLGISEVKVWQKPKAGILLTGRELVPLGRPLQPGQVYESNSHTLCAALAEARISPVLVATVDDDAEQTFQALNAALEQCNLLLITGGISVGDYDFVHGALQRAGLETLFYKIRQKPGKPIYCGRRGRALVFGLPGNPASVLSCFYQYVVPSIRQQLGLPFQPPNQKELRLSADFYKKPGLTHFIKGKSRGETVEVHHSQESYKMDAYLESDCLVEFAENQEQFLQGEKVKVHLLDRLWG